MCLRSQVFSSFLSITSRAASPALPSSSSACHKVRRSHRVTDLETSIGLVASFAAWATAHLAIVAGLAARSRWARALLGLLPPLAPLGAYWALRAGLRVRVAVWLVSLVVYLTLFSMARS